MLYIILGNGPSDAANNPLVLAANILATAINSAQQTNQVRNLINVSLLLKFTAIISSERHLVFNVCLFEFSLYFSCSHVLLLLAHLLAHLTLAISLNLST